MKSEFTEDRARDFLAVIAYVYVQHGNAASAAALLEPLHVLLPEDRDVARLLAYALLQLRRFQDCLELTDFLLSGTGSNEPSYVWLIRSRAMLGLGREEEAREHWNQFRKGGV